MSNKQPKEESRAFVIEQDDGLDLLDNFGLRRLREKERNQRTLVEKFYTKVEDDESVNISDLPTSNQIEETARGEYIKKPYSQSTLSSYIGISPRLKSCLRAMVDNTVGLGTEIMPTGSPDVKRSDLTKEEEATFVEQKKSLLNWLNRICGNGVDFQGVCEEVTRNYIGLGEAFIEVIPDASGKTYQIKSANPEIIFVGINKDRYIAVSGGNKVYFRKFWEEDPQPRRADDFTTGSVSLQEQATKLIHFKKGNFESTTYGVPGWLPSIPAILGARAAEERNKNFFDNDAVPRMAVLISGGTLTDDTIEATRSFFKKGHRGVENSNRVLILEVTGLNPNQMSYKPPTVELKPLTLGKTEDASFLNYIEACNEQIRESFGFGNLFLGTMKDVNRAAAFTMRETSVNLIFKPTGREISRKLNQTLLYAWMEEENLDEESCLVEIGFKYPNTLTQRDLAGIYKDYATSGGLSPNDLRENLGLDRVDADWANIPAIFTLGSIQSSGDDVEPIVDYTEGLDEN